MLHNIIAIYAYFAMAPLYAVGLLPYFVDIHIAELAGLSILLSYAFVNCNTYVYNQLILTFSKKEIQNIYIVIGKELTVYSGCDASIVIIDGGH